MSVRIRHAALAALLFACATTVPASAQAGISGGLGLLAVQAQIGADPAPAGPPAQDTLQAVERILALWPRLVGTLPAGDPRYNSEDIGHITQCTGANYFLAKVMEGRMVSGMKKRGIKVPDNATGGNPRPVDRDRNGGVHRAVTRAQLEQLAIDTETVHAYFEAFAARSGKSRPVNENGLSVADWQRIRNTVKDAIPVNP